MCLCSPTFKDSTKNTASAVICTERRWSWLAVQKKTVFNLATLMTGRAWDLVEDIPMDVLQSEDGFKRVFERLDKGFKFDDKRRAESTSWSSCRDLFPEDGLGLLAGQGQEEVLT